ncbi:hypothetical protein TcCL_ESM12833 [Trypanosoma cruzi]|nr:hypothetical protein TcCL_ESM12833 [Trypanosoma cruzi]
MNLKVAISPFRQQWVKVAARLSSSENSPFFTVKPKTAGKHLFRSEYLLHSNLFLAKTSTTRRGTYSKKETTIPTQQLQALRWPTSSTAASKQQKRHSMRGELRELGAKETRKEAKASNPTSDVSG